MKAGRSAGMFANTRRVSTRMAKVGVVVAMLTGLTSALVVAIGAAPAFAADTTACSAPASGGTSDTFIEGTANSYTVTCYTETGVSGTSDYPASITIASGALPADASMPTTVAGGCTQATSGSGTTEEYELECKITETPTPSDAGSYPLTFLATGQSGAPNATSGTLTLTVGTPTLTCIDPASGGSSTTFAEGTTASYTVECEGKSGVSGTTAYPSSIAIATGSFPADGNPTFATSTSSSPACTTGTSGSGTTEEYILECALSDTPTPADAGSYPFTFTATGPGGYGSVTSGTLTVTVASATMTCIDPASGGSSTTFNSSPGGTANSYTVECEAQSGISGVSAYPSSINIATQTPALPSDVTFATSTSSSPACTHGTSGSGATEEYILECPLAEDAVSADNGSYAVTFTATGPGGYGTLTSGTLTLTVTGPTTACSAPASAGTATTFYAGIANSYTVTCYSEGFSSASSGNYPASITVASGSLPSDATMATSTSSTPACTTATTGSGLTEEYELECAVTETPTSGDLGAKGPVTFQATPGANGGQTVTSGSWTLTVSPVPVTCTAPASGGTATTFYDGTSNSYSVACYGKSGISGETAYPSSITLGTGTLPADASEATSTTSSPACTTSTSGSGTSEEYILTCPVSETPTSADNGTYPVTFSAAGPGGIGATASGTWTLTVTGPVTTCSAPATGGTATTFTVGTASSYTVTCYSQGFGSANAGNYPSSITLSTGSLPSDVSEATSLTSSPACTNATSGSGISEEYETECKISETPTASDEGTYPVTFLATGGSAGAPNATSGTWTLSVKPAAPTFPADQYTNAESGQPFCYDAQAATVTAANGGLPLTGITLGATPTGVTGYGLQGVNLANGSAYVCGTETSAAGNASSISITFANSGGSATGTIDLYTYGQCTWTASQGSVSMFDKAEDLEQDGSQSAFGQPITNGETAGTTTNYPTCTDAAFYAPGLSGGAFTVNTANPLPTPTDTNPSAAQGDLASSNLELAKGCYGDAVIDLGGGEESGNFGSGAVLTVPSPWVNGGDCSYGSLGSNSAGGNTDSFATCPPTQADVNEGYVDCSITASTGNDDNASYNNTTMDLFFNGQPVPQQSTATLSASGVSPGDTVNVTGGTNWWGNSGGAPNTGPYGDDQTGAMYQVGAPGVYIGTSRASAVPVIDSTVTIPANQYVCTGAESTTVGPNPCTMTPGQPTGSFQVPSNLAPGVYNVYIDESNSTPLPGNGPNDSYQTAQGTNLGTAESSTPIVVGPPVFNSTTSTSFTENIDGGFIVSATGDGVVSLAESGVLPSGVTFSDEGTGIGTGAQTDLGLLGGTPAFGTAGSYPITITATDGNGNTTTQNFTLTVTEGSPVFTSGDGTLFFENAAGSFQVTADGDTPIGYTETGALPSGVTLSSSGLLAGTPAYGTAGSYPITITATDTNGNSTPQSFTLTVGASAPVFTSATSTAFAENAAGSFQVTADGDTPIGYTETGALPSGVTLSSSGLLAGTPAYGTAGSYPITITATDSNSTTTTQSFTLTVTASGPAFTSAATATLSENDAGTFQVSAIGDSPLSLSESGSLPSGVNFTDNGNGVASLGGTPAFGSAGSYPLVLTVTDTNGATATQDFTLTVGAEGASFTSATSTTFTENAAGSFQVTADGDEPITFSANGTLPSGVTLSSSGLLSGTPAFGTAGTYYVGFVATDGNNNVNSQAFALTVDAAAPVFTSATSTAFAENAAGSFQVTADGDTPIGYTETGALPSGVTLSSSGLLAGTPAYGTAGSYPITITATDTNNATTTQSFTLDVGNGGPAFTSGTGTLLFENTGGTFSVSADGDGPLSLSESGALPSGVSFTDNGGGDGTIGGTPAYGTAGTYPITLSVTDANTATATQSFTLTVGASPPAFTSAASTTFSEHTSGSFHVTANGDAPLSFTEAGTLPSGVTLSGAGLLSGTAAFGENGRYPITITARDGNGNTSTQSFTLTVGASAPLITSGSSTTFVAGRASAFAITATGDTPITFRESGALPSGVGLSSNGDLAGTPGSQTAGTYRITVTATDTHGATATQSFTLNVVLLEITTPSLPSGRAGATYSAYVRAIGGSGVYRWGLASGALPSGLHLNPNTGWIHGTPGRHDVSSTFTVKVWQRNSNMVGAATKTLTIKIT